LWESDKPPGPYSTEGYADQLAALLHAIGIEQAHVAGMSLGAAVGMHLAARHPGRVRSLSLHDGWPAGDDYLKIVVEQWRTISSALPTVADVVIQAIFPWCFTPEMYVDRPEFVDTLVEFVRRRPAQPVDAFVAQIDAVVAHDASAALGDIPSLSTILLIRLGAWSVAQDACAFAARGRLFRLSRMSVADHAPHGLPGGCARGE
jgi:pimeloyl-ACP methyl ester carboxylesterase